MLVRDGKPIEKALALEQMPLAEVLEAARQQGVHRAHMERGLPPSIGEIVLRDLVARDQEIKDRRRFRRDVQTARKGRCNEAAGDLLPGLWFSQ